MRHSTGRLAFCIALFSCGGGGTVTREPDAEVTDLDAAEADSAQPDAAAADTGTSCPEGEVACDGACVDPATDDHACGGCETTCAEGTGCFGGACTTPTPLGTARVGFDAALGPDGRIFAVGGVGADGQVLASVEAYDPRTNRWQEVARLPDPRAIGGVATGPDGGIYNVGGIDERGSPSEGVTRFDGETSAWTAVVDAPVAVAQMAVTGSGEGFCMMGGTGWSGLSAVVSCLDVVTSTWSDAPDLPTPRQGLAAVTTSDGAIWALAGGIPEGMEARALDTVEVYDPVTAGWAPSAELSTARFEPVAVALGTRILVTGGHGADHRTLDSTEIWQDDGWVPGPPMSGPRAGHAAAVGLDGRVYVFGGHGAEDWDVLDTMEVYDPARGVWIF